MDDKWRYQTARDFGLPLNERLKSARREPGLAAALLTSAFSLAVRTELTIFHRLRVRGRENLPAKPPFILAANHTSHLDALILGAIVPSRLRHNLLPIAAGDTFFATPAIAAFAALVMNALPMWRRNVGRHQLTELRTRLVEDPCAYILFPEGTRSRDGTMNRFKPGIGMMTAGQDVPVVPCRLVGCHEALPPGTVVPRPRKIQITIGRPLSFANEPNDRAGWTRIAAEIEAAVRDL